jgi:hypothetical protein
MSGMDFVNVLPLVLVLFEQPMWDVAACKYKQQAVESQSIICQIKTEPSSWTTAAANFVFCLTSARLAPIVALASTSFANPAFLLLAVVLFSALRGIQSPAGEKTEISLL